MTIHCALWIKVIILYSPPKNPQIFQFTELHFKSEITQRTLVICN